MGKNGTLGYNGAFRDEATGGYPLGNGYRSYLPGLMRFGAGDDASPFGAGGVNPYAYCAGDPVNRTDPTGHVFETEAALRFLGGVNSSVPLAELSQHDLDLHLNAAGAGRRAAPQAAPDGPPLARTPGMSPAADTSPGHAGLPEHLRNIVDAAYADDPTLLRMQSMPTDEAGIRQLVNDAYYHGQIEISPYRTPFPKVTFIWRPNIEVDGEKLLSNDPRLVYVAKRLGLVHNGMGPVASDSFFYAYLTFAADDITVGVAVGWHRTPYYDLDPVIVSLEEAERNCRPRTYSRAVAHRLGLSLSRDSSTLVPQTARRNQRRV